MDNKEPFDPVHYCVNLYAILSNVSVCGQNNIHNMDLVLNGLQYLKSQLIDRENETLEKELREEI